MKKYSSLLLILLLFPFVVYAGGKKDDNVGNTCVGTGSCLLVCSYTNTVDSNTYSSTIYYDYNNSSFSVDWVGRKGNISSQPINNKLVFIETSAYNNLTNKGVCPTYSFIDVKGSRDEVCFATNSTFCTVDKTKNNLGTKFSGTSTLTYQYSTVLYNFFDNQLFLNYTCNDLKNSNINIKEDYINSVQKEFLNGYAMPSFIINSDVYKYGMNKIESSISSLETSCKKAEQSALDNGEITKDEYEEEIAKIEEGVTTVETDVKQLQEELKLANFSPTSFSNCQSMFGSPNEKGTTSWYLVRVFRVMKYVAIILLLVLTIMDFVTAVSASDSDAIKKASSKAIKRFVICVVIFVLPTLIEFVLQFLNDSALDVCGIGG